MSYDSTLPAGSPASFPLPVSGQSGAQFQRNLKMHPAAVDAQPQQNPMNGGRPTLAAKGK